MIHWLSADDAPEAFPPVQRALREPPGLLAAGGDLAPPRLLAAYRRGIFPWYSPGQPVLWWSHDPREVLPIDALRVSRSLARTLKRARFALSVDSEFKAVIDACAAPRARSPGTWITPEMRTAYLQLHQRQVAHSIEVWRGAELVGGVYGVAVGRVFCGESMFSRASDASKVALVALADWCRDRGHALIDCQLPSAHLRSLGSRPMPRTEFLAYLE
ncbi:MAG: leucyl/phenylalanyl-tRNA--protein transferase [Gammaproteobacteria bacterium]|nr:leucyl/phenylalanyl-tRNA--protein transferase [Gammaproteobacteria bacterium]